MVLEALAAVSLAGNVVQFVEFTCKLFDQATTIYQSHTGCTPDSQNLESITQELQTLCANLTHGNTVSSQAHLASQSNYDSIRELAAECETTANELLARLHNLKARNPNSKWSSFRAALAVSCKERRIDAMQTRLDSYRTQLIVQLQVLQSDHQSEVFHLLEQLEVQNERLGAELGDQISDLKETFETSITKLQEHLAMRTYSALPVPEDPATAIDAERQTCTSTLFRTQKVVTDVAASLRVLDSLRFEKFDYRRSKIKDACPDTFEWMYTNQFSRWLQSTDPIFWISGKPGSGKSTLVKFLVKNPRTLTLFERTCSRRKHLIASYYFWVNGTEMQQSQEGLLRILLYDILRQCPEIIKPVLPGAWALQQQLTSVDEYRAYEWKRSDLLNAFNQLTKHNISSTRFLIFIDGLDEYHGDHDELLDAIRELSKANVKLCLASRPWNIFEQRLGNWTQHKIYLQDFNKRDIQAYVKTDLTSRQDWQILRKKDMHSADAIAGEIVEKSQGVFLWVYLVICSLREGVRNRDRLSQLQEQLREFPSDLEDFFRHILQSLDPIYRKQAVKAFQVALSGYEPLPLLLYWLLDEADTIAQGSHPIKRITMEEYFGHIEDMQVRLNGQCRGLLETTFVRQETHIDLLSDKIFVVDFLHRTVKDFLTTKDVHEVLTDARDDNFDPDLSICAGSVLAIKILPKDYEQRFHTRLFLRSFFNSAFNLDRRNCLPPMEDFDELSKVSMPFVKSSKDVESSFIVLAVNCDLRLLIEAKLKSVKKIQTQTREQLFEVSLTGRAGDFAELQRSSISLDMLRILLSYPSPSKVTVYMQECLASCFKTRYAQATNADIIYQTLHTLCSFATFEMKSATGFRDPNLNGVLQLRLSAIQHANILRLASRSKGHRLRRLRWRLWN